MEQRKRNLEGQVLREVTAMDQGRAAAQAVSNPETKPEIKAEAQDQTGSELGEGMVMVPPTTAELRNIPVGTAVQCVKQEPEDGPSQNWDTQLQEFLKTLQFPQSGERNPSEPPRQNDRQTTRGAMGASEHPKGLWLFQLRTDVVEKVGQDHDACPDSAHGRWVREGPARGDVDGMEAQRQRFRQCLYQEAEGPRRSFNKVHELCQAWLKPERHTKDQIVDLVTLEQFLAILPQEMQSWVREWEPKTCAEAVAVAEDFVRRQQEARRLEWQVTKCSEDQPVNPSETEQPPLDTLEMQVGQEAKKEPVRRATSLAAEGWPSENGDQKPVLEGSGRQPSNMAPEVSKENGSPCWEEARVNGCEGQIGSSKEEAVTTQFIFSDDLAESIVQREENKVKPEEQEESLNPSSYLSTHVSTRSEEKPYRCWHCGKILSSSLDLVAHERTHVGEKLYKCSQCGESERTHAVQNPHKCSHCGNTFSWRSQEGINTGEKPFVCSECGESFIQRSELLKHKRTHMPETPYKCLVCGKCLGNNSSLKVHQRIHTGEKPYKCSHCGKCFSRKADFLSHERIHTAVCSYCGKSFNQTSELLEHERTHTGGFFACFACGKTFHLSSELVAHVRTHKGKPFKCSHCGKTFRNRVQCITHQEAHTAEKPNRCSDCGRSFVSKTNLLAHASKHTTPNPYKCAVCGKGFHWSSHLIRHQRIHSREKPYKCTNCGKSFAWRSDLLRHQRVHAGGNK